MFELIDFNLLYTPKYQFIGIFKENLNYFTFNFLQILLLYELINYSLLSNIFHTPIFLITKSQANLR
jgi:hypothetical protein